MAPSSNNSQEDQLQSQVDVWSNKFLASVSPRILQLCAAIMLLASIQIFLFTETLERFPLAATYFLLSIMCGFCLRFT